MPRRKGMKVRWTRNRAGHLIGEPVSMAWTKRIVEHLDRTLPPDEDVYTDVHIQLDYEIEALLECLTPENRRWLDRGWDIVAIMDPFHYLTLVGWDANTLA